MIYITQNNESGQIHARKQPTTGSPENTDRTYSVRKCACFWEVRCVSREKGRITGDQLVAAVPSEQEAEALARELARPPQTMDQGRRVLEELIEEDNNAG